MGSLARFCPGLRASIHVACALALAGTAQARVMITSYAHATRHEPRTGALPVYTVEDTVPHPYRVLAVLRMGTTNTPGLTVDEGADFKAWKQEIAKSAQKLDADAVAGLHWIRHPGAQHYTLTGLAVEYREGDDAADSCGCVVAIPRPVLKFDLPPAELTRMTNDLQSRVLSALEDRGYCGLALTSEMDGGAWVAGTRKVAVSGRPVDRLFELDLSSADPDKGPTEDRSRGQGITKPDPALPAVSRMQGTFLATNGDTVWTRSISRSSDRLMDVPLSTLFLYTNVGKLDRILTEMVRTLPPPAHPIDADAKH